MKRALIFHFYLWCFCLTASVFAETTTNLRLLGVLFYKLDCPECVEVSKKTLPLAFQKFNNNGQILMVNNSTPEGSQLFLEILLERELKPSLKPPILVTQSSAWSGSFEINKNIFQLLNTPDQKNTIDPSQYSELSLLFEIANSNDKPQTARWIGRDSDSSSFTFFEIYKDNYLKDPVGNGLAIIVLVGMISSLVFIVLLMNTEKQINSPSLPWFYPALCCVAIAIAFYLFQSGITQSEPKLWSGGRMQHGTAK